MPRLSQSPQSRDLGRAWYLPLGAVLMAGAVALLVAAAVSALLPSDGANVGVGLMGFGALVLGGAAAVPLSKWWDAR